MRHRYHLLIVSPDRQRVLTLVNARGWLLPTCAGHAGQRGAILASDATAALRVDGTPTCLSSATRNASAGEIDWSCVIHAHAWDVAPDTSLRWIDPGVLLASPALWTFQRTVLSRWADGGSDGSWDWPTEIRAWIDGALTGQQRKTTGHVTVYQCSPASIVARFDTTGSPVYFKGAMDEGFVEPAVTQWLAQRYPGHFAATIVTDPLRRWWLTEHVPGEPLGTVLTDAILTRVAHTLATLQRELCSEPDALRHLGAWPASTRELVDEAARLVSDDSRERRALETALHHCRQVGTPDVWTPLDLSGANLRHHDGAVAFIDVGEFCLAPAPLALHLLIDRLTSAWASAGQGTLSRAWIDGAWAAFSHAWGGREAGLSMSAGSLASLAAAVRVLMRRRASEQAVACGELIGVSAADIRRLAAARLRHFLSVT